MKLSFMARVLLASFIVLVCSILVYVWQAILDSESRSLSLTQIVEAQPLFNPPELSGIVLSNCTLYPSFSPDITSYTATVPYNITFVTFTVTTLTPNAVVKIYPITLMPPYPYAVFTLPVGQRTLYIEVTADNVTQTYRVTVTRLPFVPSPTPTSMPAEVPETDTLILLSIGVGGLVTWVGWQRMSVRRKKWHTIYR